MTSAAVASRRQPGVAQRSCGLRITARYFESLNARRPGLRFIRKDVSRFRVGPLQSALQCQATSTLRKRPGSGDIRRRGRIARAEHRPDP